MLNRRYLRVKVFQALYGFFQDEKADLLTAEKELTKSLLKIQDLYLYMLLMLVEVADAARNQIEIKKNKRIPTEEDLNPNTKFIENKAIELIETNVIFKRLIEAKRIKWIDQQENFGTLLKQIQQHEAYKRYMQNPERSLKEDKDLLITLFEDEISEFELLASTLEENNMHWTTDMEIAGIGVVKTLQGLGKKTSIHSDIIEPLLKDDVEDMKFAKELFRKTAMNAKVYDPIIAKHTTNWDTDRIAILDIILMKMAMTEFEAFSSIPTKVSLNEYIELAKAFSTEKSRNFINGVLDKILVDLKEQGRVNKMGRGLIESSIHNTDH